MMNILEIYTKLYTYKQDENKKINLVISQIDEYLYILKELNHYDYDLYKQLKEARIAHIPRIFHLVVKENKLYIIKEYLHMQTLEEYYLNTRLDQIEIRNIILMVCNILKDLYALKDPIIHCDLTLSNLYYNGKEIYINDFDIAKLQSKREIVTQGSEGYIAPEQFFMQEASIYNDIYSLGILYYLLYKQNYGIEESSEDMELISRMIEVNKEKRIHSLDKIIEAIREMERS